MKMCAGCKQAHPLVEFWPVKKSEPDGARQGRCKACCRAHVRAYRAAHPGYSTTASLKWAYQHPERASEQTMRWSLAHPERVRIAKRAQARVRYEITVGKMVRPSICSNCGAVDRAIEAAHFDYSKPLEVTWLCRPCHRRSDSHDPKVLKFLASGLSYDADRK